MKQNNVGWKKYVFSPKIAFRNNSGLESAKKYISYQMRKGVY